MQCKRHLKRNLQKRNKPRIIWRMNRYWKQASLRKSCWAALDVLLKGISWGDRWGSNPRQPESQSGALPTELRPPLKRMPDSGVPDRNRTCNPQLRRLVLYPVELRAQFIRQTNNTSDYLNLVGVERFELPTSWSQTRRATRLRYTPRARHYTDRARKINFVREIFL